MLVNTLTKLVTHVGFTVYSPPFVCRKLYKRVVGEQVICVFSRDVVTMENRKLRENRKSWEMVILHKTEKRKLLDRRSWEMVI